MTIDWEAAFSFYAGLGVARSYTRVAQRFSVSLNAVRKHAVKNGWEERIAKIDAEARRETDARVLRNRSERIDDTLELVSLARDQILDELRGGKGDVRLTDIPALVKLEALLEGEPTDRIAIGDVQALLADMLHAARAILEEGLSRVGVQKERALILAYFDRELPARIAALVERNEPDG